MDGGKFVVADPRQWKPQTEPPTLPLSPDPSLGGVTWYEDYSGSIYPGYGTFYDVVAANIDKVLLDAPVDGSTYGRKNAAWVPVASQVVSGATAPPLADNQFWFDSASLSLFIAYNDGNSVQWVPTIVAPPGPPGPQGLMGPPGPMGPVGPVGPGGVGEAPIDGNTYGRLGGAWTQVLSLSGGTLTGGLGVASPGITFPAMGLAAANFQFAWQGNRINPFVNGTAQGSIAYTSDLTNYLPTMGGTVGPLTITDPAGQSNKLTLTGPGPDSPGIIGNATTSGAGQQAALYLQGRRNNLSRWQIQLGSTELETGGNTGSNFYITSSNDAGQQLATPMIITRANSAVTFAGSVTAAAGAFSTLSASGTVSGAGFTTLLAPYAPLASPPLTGVPTAPTAVASTNTTQIATTAYVVGQAGTATPVMNAATAVVGSSLLYARQDHVHPSDSAKFNTAGGTITGATTISAGGLTVSGGQANISSGTLNIGTNTTVGIATVNGPAGSSGRGFYLETAGLNRWQINLDAVAEGGSDAGGNLGFYNYHDNGSFIGNPLTITRATGLATFAGGVSFGSQIGSSNTDLSKHIALYGTANGFCLANSRINYVGGPAFPTHVMMANGADLLTVSASGAVVAGALATSSPGAAKTGTTYTVATTDSALLLAPTGTMTLTLLAPATYPGRILDLKLTTAFAVNSAASNVVPLAGGAAGTGILTAAAGKFARLMSDGTSWQIMAAN